MVKFTEFTPNLRITAAKKAEVDTKNERITLDGDAYAVENGIVGFDIKMDGKKS